MVFGFPKSPKLPHESSTSTLLHHGQTAAETASRKARKRTPYYQIYSALVVESKAFTALTLFLTVYALTADDTRLLAFDQPADTMFNIMTMFCLLVFSVEIFLCILGKDDYFLSFFFILDIVSTVTLLLDLTWVSDSLQGDEDDVNNLRGSRTAKIGSRATRIVRVIRLVRIVKLYKAFLEAQAAKRRQRRRSQDPGEDEDNWDDIVMSSGDGRHRESRVGKKLLDLTTRRVICLVLVMMLVQKALRVDQSIQFPKSASYGADMVYEAFTKMEANPASTVLREKYERMVLKFVYYHSWFTAQQQNCPSADDMCSKDYSSAVFWMGIIAKNQTQLEEKIKLAQLSPSTVAAFEQEVASTLEGTPYMYNLGPMPSRVQARLGADWDARCKSGEYYRRGLSMLAESLNGTVDYLVDCPDQLRRSERKPYTARLHIKPAQFDAWRFIFYFDTRPYVQEEALFSLLTVSFVCVMLLGASVLFSQDANRLVLGPVENMVAKVETIRDNPIMAMKVADDEFKLEEFQKAKARSQEKHFWHRAIDILTCHGNKNEASKEIMETVVLEKTIIKLGSLLALGFGKAGAKIIAHNMKGSDSAAINAMVEGTRVDCVIGSARIKDFTVATEVLQANVMTFVNQIAEIVHGVVDEFHGYSSRNGGDHFLTIWRISDLAPERVKKMADMSVLAVVRILAALHRSPVLAAYRGHPGLQQRLGRHCRVNLRSGLHYGWAIEGAVGTEFKIDPSYLSPNVSIAESVECAAGLYGVQFLITESVVEMCTQEMASKCRHIDRVKLQVALKPLELHVIDLDHLALTVEVHPGYPLWNSRQRFRCRQHLEAEKNKKMSEQTQIVSYFDEDPDIQVMQQRFSMEFVHIFNMGFQNYSEGEWSIARRLLSRTRNMMGREDGPSSSLLKFMECYNHKAPDWWQGIRPLPASILEAQL